MARTARVVGFGFLAGLGVASCRSLDSATFNEEAADLVSDIARECGEDLTSAFDGDEENGGVDILPDLDACSRNCEFKRASARKCLRRLEKMADDCEDRLLGPCRRVYRNCDEGFNASRCNIWNCSVAPGSGAGGAFWLGMVALLGLARRRRRS